MTKLSRTLALLVAVAAIAGFATVGLSADKKEKKLEPINDKCPLSGRDINKDKTVKVEYLVCCGGCEKKATKDPSKAFSKLDKLPNDKCPFTGKDVNKSKKIAVAVAFCCGNCEKKFAEAPAKYIGKVKPADKKDG